MIFSPMHTARNIWTLIFFGYILLAASGCGLPPPNLQQLAPIARDSICRVAILPFNNETSYSQGDIIMYRVFAAELSHRGKFMITPEGDVRKILHQMHTVPGEDFNIEQIRILADRLQAQLLITANIIEMDENMSSNRTNPTLAIIFRILDADSGRILWVTYHRREGGQYRKVMHFGVVNTVTELVRRVSHEIIESWFTVGGLPQCTD
jgi:hypothetical protein